MSTLVQRCHSGQQGQVWKNAASKALYLQDKAKGDIVSKALLSTAVSYPYITKFYTVVKSPQKQARAPAYIVKLGVTFEQKSYSEVN